MAKLIEKLHARRLEVDTHYRVGMRVIKTAIAVMICLAISFLIKSNNAMQISTVSALVTLRSTQQDTIHTGGFRVLGTVIGGAIGMLTVLVGLFLPHYEDGLFIVIIPLMLILNLYVCNIFKLQDSCSIACVVIIIVATRVTPSETVAGSLLFTAMRIRDTLIGVVVSSALNTLSILHRKPEKEDTESCDIH